jgi:hypothetical protein
VKAAYRLLREVGILHMAYLFGLRPEDGYGCLLHDLAYELPRLCLLGARRNTGIEERRVLAPAAIVFP